MDTRFWGPSGWKLFHLITFDYEHTPFSSVSLANFLETIPYILPCKFCRASLTDYYRQHPYRSENGSMIPTLDLKKWMYTIHNSVNAKLRKQGLHPAADPTYAEVKKVYTTFQQASWEEQLLSFWDFLFSVAYHHPKEASFDSKPMPDCPEDVTTCKDPCEKNKWNVLHWKQRMYWYRRFWTFLPAVLPHEIAKRWEEVEKQNPPTLSCRRSALAWLWRMRCGLDSTFHDPYTSVCHRIKTYSSDCGKKSGAITCRRHKGTRKNKTLRKRK
jgi:hypothetical protein